MGGFLYYFPGAERSPRREELDGLGLGFLPAGLPHKGRPEAGPGDGRGCLTCICGRGETAPAYDADGQEWQKCAGGKFWIGWPKGGKPGPDDLVRDKDRIIGDWQKELLDGNMWTFASQTFLPSYLGLSPEGNRARVVKAEYADLAVFADGIMAWRQAKERFFETLSAAGLKDFRDASFASVPDEPKAVLVEAFREMTALYEAADLEAAAIRMLGVNYRVSAAEVYALGLLDDGLVQFLCLALIDAPEVQPAGAEEKKNG